jgi:hypothetical protein
MSVIAAALPGELRPKVASKDPRPEAAEVSFSHSAEEVQRAVAATASVPVLRGMAWLSRLARDTTARG